MRTLRRLLTHNLGWKLGSLGLAMVLWLAVVGEPELITVQPANVYFRNLRPGMVIEPDVGTLQLELRGAPAALNRENLSGVKVLVDLAGVAEAGERAFPISSRDVTLPEGVSFLSAAPPRVTVKVTVEEGSASRRP